MGVDFVLGTLESSFIRKRPRRHEKKNFRKKASQFHALKKRQRHKSEKECRPVAVTPPVKEESSSTKFTPSLKLGWPR